MTTTSPDLKTQIEAAFDYRGHVTLTLADGGTLEGFLYNRDFAAKEPFVEVFLKNSEERRRLPVSRLASVALSGEDCAAGKSFEDLKKKPGA